MESANHAIVPEERELIQRWHSNETDELVIKWKEISVWKPTKRFRYKKRFQVNTFNFVLHSLKVITSRCLHITYSVPSLIARIEGLFYVLVNN